MFPNAESLVQNIDALTPLALAGVTLAGLLVGIAPSSFPLISIASGFGAGFDPAGDHSRQRGLWLSLGFVAGIVSVDVVLGALFSALSALPSWGRSCRFLLPPTR
jgi:cytochrome c-type biogenesis protein